MKNYSEPIYRCNSNVVTSISHARTELQTPNQLHVHKWSTRNKKPTAHKQNKTLYTFTSSKIKEQPIVLVDVFNLHGCSSANLV